MGLFRFFHDVSEIMANNRADKENRQRGRDHLRQREVQALERIARASEARTAPDPKKAKDLDT